MIYWFSPWSALIPSSCIVTSCIQDTYLRICNWIIWAICVHVYEANSQVLGQKPRRSYHFKTERKSWNQVLLFSFTFFFCASSSSYHPKCVHLCRRHGGKQASLLKCWTVLLLAQPLLRSSTALLFHSFLLEFTYLFIQIHLVGQAEPTIWIPF